MRDHSITIGGQVRAALAGLCVAALTFGPDIAIARITEESATYYEEARKHIEAGDAEAAVIQLKNAIRTSPDHVEARRDLALIYVRLRDGASAEKELKAADKKKG